MEELVYAMDSLTMAIERRADNTIDEIFSRREFVGEYMVGVKVFRALVKIDYGTTATLFILTGDAGKPKRTGRIGTEFTEREFLPVREEWQAQQRALVYFDDFISRLPQTQPENVVEF